MRAGKKRPVRGWKQKLADLPVLKPDLVVPLDWNPMSISTYSKLLGMKFTWRRGSDGWHIWRVE